MFSRSFTLQDMCLISIVRNINFFVYKKTIPQKHIDFLFRVYSDEVFSKLEVLKKSVSEDCMLWLLNPHVKKVNVPCHFQSERVVQKLKVIGFGITSLDLSALWFSHADIYENILNSIVCCIPHVVHLNLSNTSCSDKTLVCIQKSCEDLESLNVSHCYKITNRGMENLCRVRVYSDEVLSKLQDLEKSVNEDCMLWLLNPHAKKVAIPCDLQSKRVIQKLKMIGFGITSLDLSSSWFSHSDVYEDVLNSIVCCIPHVVRLNFSNTSCSDKTLVCIQKSCEDLESLIIRHCYEITNRGMENLCRGKLLLKNLYVKGTRVNYSGIITVLDGMPSLEWIDYDELTATLYKFGNKKQYNLKEFLYNSCNQWDDECTVDSKKIQAFVKMCPKLKKLHFKQHVSQNVLNACAHFQNLEELKIKMSHTSGLKVSDVLIPILPISENLQSLILSCVTISLVTLVERFKSLKKLYLKKVSFTPFEKEDIKISETNLLTIVMKDMDMEGVTYEGVTSLISLSKNVSKLYLKHMHLPPEIFDVILQSMKNLSVVNFQFTHVDMQYVNPFFEIPSMSTVVVNKEKRYVNPFFEIPLVSAVVVNKNISANELFGKSTSCTLSWRNMCDCAINANEDNHVNKCYYNKRERDESDIISDQCDCFDAENEYDGHISYRDCIIDDNDYPSD